MVCWPLHNDDRIGAVMTRAPQAGTSLISMMIGLVISSVAILGLMSVFQAVAHSTANAKDASSNDDQLTSSLLRAGMSLQDAGYGISAPVFNTHIVLLTGAALSAPVAGGQTFSSGTVAAIGNTTPNAVVWTRQISGGAIECAGLYAPAVGGLQSLNAATCTNATDWSALSWKVSTMVESPATNQFRSVIRFTAAAPAAGCQPYGITTTGGLYTVSLSTTNSAGVTIPSLYCLLNFH